MAKVGVTEEEEGEKSVTGLRRFQMRHFGPRTQPVTEKDVFNTQQPVVSFFGLHY